jgi:hypothetical protein
MSLGVATSVATEGAEENRQAMDRAKHRRADAERIKGDPTLQDPGDQAAIQRAIDDLDRELELRMQSPRRRLMFQRRRMLPPD